MRSKLKCGVLIISMLISAYLVLIMKNENVFNSIPQGLIILVYLVLATYLLLVWIRKEIGKLKKRHYLLTGIFAVVALLFCGQNVLLRFGKDTSISITAVGKSNDAALSSEVWLQSIEADGVSIDLSSIPLAEGWQHNGALFSCPTEKEYTQTILVKNADSIKIYFGMHAWSGGVLVETSTQRKEIDLYSQEGSAYICELNGDYYDHWLINIFSIISFFLAVFYLGSLLIILIGKIGMLKMLEKNISQWKCVTFWQKLLICLVSVIICFQFVGEEWFLLDKSNLLKDVIKFCILILLAVQVLLALLRWMQSLEYAIREKHDVNNIGKITRKTRILIFLASILLALPLIVSIKEVFFFDAGPTTISIMPTGEKNNRSNGTEVILSEIKVNGALYRPEIFNALPEGWINNGGTIFGVGSLPLTISIPEHGEVALYFGKHQWSGIVEIQDGQQITRIDLFADVGSQTSVYEYAVKGNKQGPNIWSDVIGTCVLAILVVGIWYFVILQVSKAWKNTNGGRGFSFTIFMLEMTIFFYYIMASYPAAISTDSKTQLNQVLGLEKMSDAHSALHTLFIKWVTMDGEWLVAFPIVQSICISILSALILGCLHRTRISKKVLIVFACMQALAINNGIYVAIIWKDILYSYCLLWLTYLLFRFESDIKYIGKKRNLLALVLALSLTYLLRHNGLVVLIGAICMLILWGWFRKEIKYFIAVLVSLLTISFVREVIYPSLGVETVNVASSGVSSVLHGIVYVGISGDVPKETEEFLEGFMPLSEWKQCYSPYSANELFMSDIAVTNDVLGKLANSDTVEMIREYLRVLFHNPLRLIEDRLYGIDILWNIAQNNGYNWRTANNTYELGVIENEMGWYRCNNVLTNVIKEYYKISTDYKLLDAIFWRAGIWNSCLLFLICYCCIKKNMYWSIFLPVFCNIISLGLAMAWQDYRYVYFINLCVPYILLFCFSIPKNMVSED